MKSPAMDTALAILPQSAHERAGALGGGIIAIISGLLGQHGPELVVWILALMGIDLASGLLRALIRETEDVSGRQFAKGVLKKMAMILLLAPAAAVDRALHLSDLIADTAGPTGFAVLIGLMMYESASIVRNVNKAVGSTILTLQLLRAIDTVRSGGEPPTRRLYDPPQKEEDPS